MAQPTQQDIQSLTAAISKLSTAVGGGSGRISSYSKGSTSVNGTGKSANGPIDIDKLKNIIGNNGSLLKQFDLLGKRIRNMSDIYDKLERDTRDQGAEARKLNKTLSDLVGKAKDSTKALEDLNKVSVDVKKSMETYAKKVETYSNGMKVLDDLNRKRADLNNELMKAEQKLMAVKKQKKSTKSAKADVDAVKAKQKNLDDNITDLTKHTDSLKTSLDESITVLEKYNGITGALSTTQIQNLKNYRNINTASQDYKKTVDKLNESSVHFDKGLGTVAGVLETRAKKISGAFDNFTAGMKKAGMALLTIAPVRAYNDLKSQLKNNVGESDYLHAGMMGMSESERSDAIGENRIGLRVLGGGDEAQGFRGGGKEIQKSAQQYGVTGADGLKLGLQYQNSLINSGFGGKAKDTADQMTVMHNFAKDLGVTDEQLKSFTDSLQDSGQMADLQFKYANLDDQSRRKAINEEIKSRIALSTQLGISLDRQKQLNQESINKQYGGIASAIMSNVGAGQEISQYNGDNKGNELSSTEMSAYKQGRSRGTNSLSDDQFKDYDSAKKKISQNRSSKLANAANTSDSAFYGAEAKYVDSMRPLVGNMQDEDVSNNNDRLRQQSLKGTQVVAPNSYENDQQNITNKTKNGIIDAIPGMEKFNGAILDATQRLGGLAKNPVGAALGAAGSAVGSLGGTLLGHGLKSLLFSGGGAAAEGGAVAAGGTAVGGATTAVGGAAAGGLGAAAIGTAAVTGAAAIGYGIGTLISKAIEGTKYGDRAGEYIANTAKYVSSDASDAVDGMNNAVQVQQQGDSRRSQLDNVTQSMRDAVKAKGTSGEAAARQKAEQLRGDYKTQFGVDITGGSVGYAAMAGSSSGLNNMMKNDPALMNQTQNAARTAQDEQTDQLNKLVDLTKKQNDLMDKADKKSDKPTSESGATWKQYADHIDQVRKGIGAK